MSNFGDMKDRIADEILRTDIDANISDAIITAIRYYRNEKFYFNTTTDTVTAVDSTITTALPATFQSPISARLQSATGQYVPLTFKPYKWIEDRYTSSSLEGEPAFYSIFNENFYWWLIPVQNYTVYLSFVERIAEPSADADTSGWFTDAEALIRLHAKGVVYADVLQSPDQAGANFSMAERELGRLRRESAGRNFNPSLTASW